MVLAAWKCLSHTAHVCEQHSLQRMMSLSYVRDFSPVDQPLRRGTQGSSLPRWPTAGTVYRHVPGLYRAKGQRHHMASIYPFQVDNAPTPRVSDAAAMTSHRCVLRPACFGAAAGLQARSRGRRTTTSPAAASGLRTRGLYAINTSRPQEPFNLTDWAADINTSSRHDTHN